MKEVIVEKVSDTEVDVITKESKETRVKKSLKNLKRERELKIEGKNKVVARLDGEIAELDSKISQAEQQGVVEDVPAVVEEPIEEVIE